MTRNTLPLAIRHFHPGISPAYVFIDGLAFFVGALGFGGASRYGCIAKCRYLDVLILHAVIFGGLRTCQQFNLARYFAVRSGADEFVGYQWSDEVRIIRFLRLHPLLFECGYSFLSSSGLGLQPSNNR